MNDVKGISFFLIFSILFTLLCGCNNPQQWESPSYLQEETPTSVEQLVSNEEQKAPSVVISEVLPSNQSYLAVAGEYYDLVEVQNVSSGIVSLEGYSLSDKQDKRDKYQFPSVSLAPGECYVVYCSGNTALGEQHASFKISLKKGETVYLSLGGIIVDQLALPQYLGKNQSYGRVGEALQCFYTPTPGKANPQGAMAVVEPPKAGLPSGVYETAQQMALTGEGTIYYTTDGSCPTTKSKVYSKPITVNGVMTVRAICVTKGKQSEPSAFTYVVGKQHDLPVVTVSIPKEQLQGEKAGILNHIEKTYEYECQLTLLEQGEEAFSVPCGFRLHGNGSREMPKQNFQLRFREKYGQSKLCYPLFENRSFDSYDSLLLKGGSEDWGIAVMRDEVATTLLEGQTALYTQAYKPVVLYLAGEYWGVYYLRERFSDAYVASHLNVKKESVDLLVSTDGYVQDGSSKDFDALKQYVKTHDMSKDTHYEYLCSQIDVNSLMDWYICRSYMGDKDLANIRRFRSTEGDGKWRWMYFDLDWAFYIDTDNPVKDIVHNSNGEPILIGALLKHKKGKQAFVERYAALMKTVLNEQQISQRVDAIAHEIRSEMKADRARWGGSVAGWEKHLETIKNYFKNGKRDARVKKDIQAYFSLTDQQMKQYFGE